MNFPVHIFFRKKEEGFYSIEGVFDSIITELKKKVDPTIIHLPSKNASPISIFRNSIFAFKNKGKINHVTGDIHYIVPLLGKKTILTIHDIGAAFNGNSIRDLYIKLFWLWLPAFFVKLITVISRTSADEVEKYIPFARHKIKIIHNPVNPSLEFSPKVEMPSKPKILHLGTKSNKNLERVIEALSEIDCKLTIIGKLSEQLIKLLHRFQVDYINKYDLPYGEIVDCYQQCDIVSFPSLYEGFGMPVIEAQAIGRPVLAGDIEVLHEVAGDGSLFVDPLSVSKIREGFLKLISDDTLRQNLINIGRENVKRFNINTIANQYLKLYKDLKS